MNRLIVASVALLAAASATAWAQHYPVKPIRFIAPFPPGGGNDFIARVAAHKLTEAMKQQVIVENRPGAGGTIGTEIGVRSAPDGYTFTVVGGSYAANPSLYKLAFDPIHDVSPVIQFSQGPYVIVVHPSLRLKSVKELIALARAKPGALNFASAGQGGLQHLAIELFSMMAGITMTHIPYRGTGPAVTDTIAGHTQLLWGSAAAAVPQVKNGKLHAIGVSTAQRIPALPDVPTVDESGLKGYVVILWHGLIGPKGMQRPIVDRVNADLNNALKAKEMEDKLAADGVSAAGGTPEQLAALIKRDIEVWRGVVQRAGVKAE